MFAIDATDTSNICSNHAFVATLVGAALLERGDAGLGQILSDLRSKLSQAVEQLTALQASSSPFHSPQVTTK